jgi:hypothetical protein
MDPEIVDDGKIFYGEFPKHGKMALSAPQPEGRGSMA